MLINTKVILHNGECNLPSWVLTWIGCVLKVSNGQLLTCWREFVKIWSSTVARLNPVPCYVHKMVKGLFEFKNVNLDSISSASIQRLDLWSLPRAYFGRIKNSVAPFSLTESKLPSSNTLGEADVLQGPHRGHRRGRKRRRIRPFLTGLKLGCKILSLYSHTPSVFLQRLGNAKKNMINYTDSGVKGFWVCVLYTDGNDPYSDNYTTMC